MNELLHKFKLGNDAELLLENRGGFEKVATVPIGSQALGVTQSAQGVRKYTVGDVDVTDELIRGASAIERFSALIRGGIVRCHVYGNSMLAQVGSHFATAAGQSGARLQVVQNSAVTGYTSQNIIDKLAADGINPLCDAVVWQEGTNDSGATVTTLRHIANMKTFIAAVIAAGKIPIVFMCPPTDSASYIDKVNQYSLRELFTAKDLGIPVFDPYRRYRDSDGSWVAGASTDTIHPILTVYSQAGVDLWADMSSGKTTTWLPTKNAGMGILGTNNVLHLTDSNADGLPDGWSVAALSSPVYALSNFAYPWVGKKLSVGLNQTAAGAVYKNVSAGFSAGDKLRLSGILGLAASSNCWLQCYIQCKNAGGTILHKLVPWSASQDVAAGQFECELTVPDSTALIEMYIFAQTATTGAYSGTLEIGLFELYNVTTLIST